MYAIRIAVSKRKPRNVEQLLDSIKRLKQFIVAAKKTGDRLMVILPVAVISQIEHTLDGQLTDCMVQLLEYPDDLYNRALKKAELQGKQLTTFDKAKLLTSCMKRLPLNSAKRITAPCEPFTDEYDRLKRIIHNIETEHSI